MTHHDAKDKTSLLAALSANDPANPMSWLAAALLGLAWFGLLVSLDAFGFGTAFIFALAVIGLLVVLVKSLRSAVVLGIIAIWFVLR